MCAGRAFPRHCMKMVGEYDAGALRGEEEGGSDRQKATWWARAARARSSTSSISGRAAGSMFSMDVTRSARGREWCVGCVAHTHTHTPTRACTVSGGGGGGGAMIMPSQSQLCAFHPSSRASAGCGFGGLSPKPCHIEYMATASLALSRSCLWLIEMSGVFGLETTRCPGLGPWTALRATPGMRNGAEGGGRAL